jgi:hypothetical protein
LVVPGFHFPLLACDIDDIDVDLVSWRNPNSDATAKPYLAYDDYNLIFDVPYEGMDRSKNTERTEKSTSKKSQRVFSIVKHWPPEWALKTKDDRD